MKIIFYSKTGNIKRFLNKVQVEQEIIEITDNLIINDNYILVTPTYHFGEIPEEVSNFLNKNHHQLKGVVGSGNRNWGVYYNQAAHKISQKYGIPLLQTFELAGNSHEIYEFENIMKDLK